MPSVNALRAPIEDLAERSVNDFLRTMHERHLAQPETFDDVHPDCAAAPRCLAAGPADVPEEIFQRLEDELLSRHFSEDQHDADEHTACTDLFAQAFARAWQARVKPCK